MYRYYLGSFGNKSFIRPQYEILNDGSLSDMSETRWDDFPNGGTVSLAYNNGSDLAEVKNRLLRFKIDFEVNKSESYDKSNRYSNKYIIPLENIEELESELIIEIINIECGIDDFLKDKTKRTIRLRHRPNKLILLKAEQDCYGPFEFIISDIENTAGDETYYTIKIIVTSGSIKKYRSHDLQRFVFDGTYSIRGNDRLQFIYSLEKLNTNASYDIIEYFDNEELADFFKDLMNKSEDIEEIASLRERFIHVADSYPEKNNLDEKRIQRICEILQTSTDLSEYKVRLLDEYFRINPESKRDKEEYLETHPEVLEEVVHKDSRYEERIDQVRKEIEEKQSQKESIISEIEEAKHELDLKKSELEKLGEEAIAQKKQEIEAIVNSKKGELDALDDAIKEANKKEKDAKESSVRWQTSLDQIKREYQEAKNNFNAMIVDLATQSRKSDLIKLFVSQLEMKEEGKVEAVSLKEIPNLRKDLKSDQIISMVCKKLSEADRSISQDEALNYLISITQNYITVFAGEPGTGKTSLCKLLAKALGVYDTRFADIPVERGWTSSKDLIGYYNPLTKEIEETQPVFSKCMKILNAENEKGIVQAPYFVLLDEANLSPIEYYWSHFNYFCDDPASQKVEYSNGTKYCFGSELKFLATINYDQTTADLSPRFLDRAWVISMGQINADTVIAATKMEAEVKNSDEVIALHLLNELYDWHNIKDKKMNSTTKTRLDRIVDKMREGGHTISARSIHAITHYYIVAENYMSSKEIALDYAISQKILPCIYGSGKAYGEFLNGLMTICKENQLTKCATILSRIIDRSEHGFYGFFSL